MIKLPISFRLVFIITSLITAQACGNKGHELKSAPRSQYQAGIIGKCVSVTEAKAFAQKHSIQYRVINAKRELIEFVGIQEQELRSHFPQIKTLANKFYDEELIESSGETSTLSFHNTPYFGSGQPISLANSYPSDFTHLGQIQASAHSEQALGQGVTIAVIDTGVSYNHPHIRNNIALNPNEGHGENANARDDDGNGFIDDYVGWDFVDGDAYPIDDNGHGTHVAGLAAGQVAGVAPKAKILPIKVLNAQGRGDLATIAAGILYALDRGADIINLSLGGSGAQQASSDLERLLSSILKAKDNNALIVAAAGNGGSDKLGDCNDEFPVYPANFNVENILSVASVDAFNRLTSYSNFGTRSVHIAAPGGSFETGGLLSLAPVSCAGLCPANASPYVSMSGTSMATPVVAGVAARIKSANGHLGHKEIKDIIINSSTYEPSLEGKVSSSGIVNADAATRMATR